MKKVISACMSFVILLAVFTSSCTFSAMFPGDVNGDGVLTNKDVVILFRYVVGVGRPPGRQLDTGVPH